MYKTMQLVGVLMVTTAISTQSDTNHCIKQLDTLNEKKIQLPLSTDISSINSIAKDPDRIYIAGDIKTNHTDYSFINIYNKGLTNLLHSSYWETPIKPNILHIKSFNVTLFNYKTRSFTKVISHPTKNIYYIIGYNQIKAYNKTNFKIIWSLNQNNLTKCSQTNNKPNIILNDIIFIKNDYDILYVSGSCNDNFNDIIIDEYNVNNGKLINRVKHNITTFAFGFSIKNISINTPEFGLIPPDISLLAPANNTIQNELIEHTNQVYFYISVTHLLFQGYSRVIKNIDTNEYKVHKFLWRELNPSIFTHKSIVSNKNDNSIITLNTQGYIEALLANGTTKNIEKWDTKYSGPYTKVITEEKDYEKYSWYGNDNYGIKSTFFEWNVIIDTNNYNNIYILTSPIIELTGPAHIAKQTTQDGNIISGTMLDDFYILDGIVNDDGNLIVVGFKWNPKINFTDWKQSQMLLRDAQYIIINTTEKHNDNTCIACEINYFGNKCESKCECNGKGYCEDGITGTGKCYCTHNTFGEHCYDCKCGFPNGICDSGGNGTGLCKYCYNITVLPDPSFALSHNYGPMCDIPCLCDTKYGICNPKGLDGTGECIHCTDDTKYGTFCNLTCNCNTYKQYCDSGIHGAGCVDYSYGGISFKYDYYVYIITPSVLFIIFLITTLYITKNDFKKNNRGNVPCCPKRNKTTKINLLSNEKQLISNSNPNFNMDKNENNDKNEVSKPIVNHGNNNVINNSNQNKLSNSNYMRYNV